MTSIIYYKLNINNNMGQHTWFVKNRELFLKQDELYKKLDDHDNGLIFLEEIELLQIQHEIDEIEDKNESEYHDIFRTNKRNHDGTYIDDIIISKKDCFKWLDENNVSYKQIYNETEEQELEHKNQALVLLNEFWEKYPDGLIYFG